MTIYFEQCLRQLSSSVRAGNVRIEPAEVERCTARVDATTQGCDWVAPTRASAPSECALAVTGLVGEGGRCTSSLECAGALHCAGQGASTPGVCKPPQPIGAACGTGVDALATYLATGSLDSQKPACTDFCSLPSHRCEAMPPVGAACRASVNCARNQLCEDGHCAPRGEARAGLARAGDACAKDLDCAQGGCVTNPDGSRACAKKCRFEKR